MQEGDEELSEEALPQLPASVHVRKSSVACSKVRGSNAPPPETLPRYCVNNLRQCIGTADLSRQRLRQCLCCGKWFALLRCAPPGGMSPHSTRTLLDAVMQNNELVELLQERVRELEAEAEASKQQLAVTEQELQDSQNAHQ